MSAETPFHRSGFDDPTPARGQYKRPFTHVCLDCGALGYAGGYHDHGNENAGLTIRLDALPTAIRSFQKIEDERDELRQECDELADLLTEGVRQDYGTPGWRARAIKAGCIR